MMTDGLDAIFADGQARDTPGKLSRGRSGWSRRFSP